VILRKVAQLKETIVSLPRVQPSLVEAEAIDAEAGTSLQE